MMEHTILELIWSESIGVRQADMLSPLARLLAALLSVPVVSLVSNTGLCRPIALTEGRELLPGAPLGDVLAEELGAHVPRNAVVLIEPIEFADSTDIAAGELGRELGAVLMSLADFVGGPLDDAASCARNSVPDAGSQWRQPEGAQYGAMVSNGAGGRKQRSARA